MVTSARERRRTSWMRSASCGVVIEPSTSDRSYGPATIAPRRLGEIGDLDRAGDGEQLVLAIEQLSWQPSQEANFQTASFGLRLVVAAIVRSPASGKSRLTRS